VLWCLLNPSTADHEADDPTIRRLTGFARRWDAGGIVVVNLFGSSAPRIRANWRRPPIRLGPHNDAHLLADAVVYGHLIAGVGGEWRQAHGGACGGGARHAALA